MYMNRLLILGMIYLFLCGSIGCSGGGGESSGNGSSALIGPAGGTLISDDGLLTVIIPAGALVDSLQLSISPASEKDLPSRIASAIVPTNIYRLSPNDLSFSTPVSVQLRVTYVAIGDGFATNLPLLTTASTNVSLAKNQHLEIDEDSGTAMLSGEIDHFSIIWNSLPRSNAGINISLSGVPSVAPVQTQSFAATVSFSKPAADRLSVEKLSFTDSTLAPIGFVPQGRQLIFTSSLKPERNQTISDSFGYRCITDGAASMRTTINLESVSAGSLLNPGIVEPTPGFNGEPIDSSISYTRTVSCGTGDNVTAFPVAPAGTTGCQALSGYAYKNIDGDCGIGVTAVSAPDATQFFLSPFGLNGAVEFSYFSGSTTTAFTKSRNLTVFDSARHICTISCLEDGTAFRLGCQSDADSSFSCSELFVR